MRNLSKLSTLEAVSIGMLLAAIYTDIALLLVIA